MTLGGACCCCARQEGRTSPQKVTGGPLELNSEESGLGKLVNGEGGSGRAWREREIETEGA